METPFMYLIGYDRHFIKTCNPGWGCGYVAIPTDHPLVITNFERIATENELKDNAPEEEYIYVNNYLEIPNIEQEITYTEAKQINGKDYIIVGFDTAHIYNSSEHNMEYVLSETKKILDIILLIS